MSLFVFFISLLIVAQHVSGNHVPIIRSWRLRDVIASCWYGPWLQQGGQVRLVGSASMEALPANRSWQPSRSHGTYQHEAITSRSGQLLMMGTWLPETCWATIRREIKNTKKWHLVGFSYPHPYKCLLWSYLTTKPRLETHIITAPLTGHYYQARSSKRKKVPKFHLCNWVSLNKSEKSSIYIKRGYRKGMPEIHG